MIYVLFYESADDVAARAPAHFPEHWARCETFRSRGLMLMVGTFGDPQGQGSMAVFTTKAGAEEFCDGDPFVVHGVVRRAEIREWNEAFGRASA